MINALSFSRRKCTSPNTLSIQVPVFSCLGQSLPDLNQVTATTSSSGTMLLVPPRGTPHRGTSYPPPSPPLRRAPALTLSRNPPLLKTRHIASTSTTLSTTSCEVEIPVIAGSFKYKITFMRLCVLITKTYNNSIFYCTTTKYTMYRNSKVIMMCKSLFRNNFIHFFTITPFKHKVQSFSSTPIPIFWLCLFKTLRFLRSHQWTTF